ncbi:MAG: lactoylglutathione lyase family protein [Planctomycetota bacterium]|nr:lactoylglutathione lyase family protein [Planctomycetota bacterium]
MELFLIEISVSDWDHSLAWYRDTLGLQPSLIDESHRYALLSVLGANLAIRQEKRVGEHSGFRLTFRVENLDTSRSRLIGLGVPVGEPTENIEEHFREARLTDPDGTPITLFEWTR